MSKSHVFKYDNGGEANAILINARSIRNKNDELLFLLNSGIYHFICITETWATDDRDFPISNNYTIFTANRTSRGGGAAIIFRDNIPSNLITADSIDNAEILCADFGLGDCSFRIILTYRPPSLPLLSTEKIFVKLSSLITNRTILLGYFNFNCNHFDLCANPP